MGVQAVPNNPMTIREKKLVQWIGRIRTKKLKCRRNGKRDLRVEAVLSHTLSKAENELREKQVVRLQKLQALKKRLRDLEEQSKNGKEYTECRYVDQWRDTEPLCPELSSLDDFMSQVAKVKRPLQR